MPKSVKTLIILTAICSLICPLFTFFFHYYGYSGPLEWFSLSFAGLSQGWLWQLLTYFFIQSTTPAIHLSLFFTLFFSLFLLWFAAKDIVLRFGNVKFTLFYLSAGLFAGIISGIYLYFSHSPAILATSAAPIFASVMVWTLLFADLQFHYFFLIRVKARYLVAILFAVPLLIHLSTGDFALFINEVAGIFWGYIAGVFFFKLPPLFSFKKERKVEEEDIFMDRMLSKIAKSGLHSLSAQERLRMDAISKRKGT